MRTDFFFAVPSIYPLIVIESISDFSYQVFGQLAAILINIIFVLFSNIFNIIPF